MSQVEDVTVRKRFAPLAWLEGILFVPLGICFAAARRGAGWGGVAVVLMLMLAVFVWYRAFSLRLNQGMLCYRTLFSGVTTIPIIDIEGARIEIGCFTFSDRFRPTVRLVIAPRKRSGVRQLDVNVKVFEQDDIERLLDVLPFADGERNAS
jgi:hypothetical protein